MRLADYENTNKSLSIEDLKRIVLLFHYPYFKDDEASIEDNMKRKLVVTPSFNNYGNINTWLFSLNGSPPKGEAVLILSGGINWKSVKDLNIILISGSRFSRMYRNIKINLVFQNYLKNLVNEDRCIYCQGDTD